MKQKFFNLLIKDLIEKKDYIPVQNENGEMLINEGFSMLQKISFGSYMLIQIIDGDRFSAEEIKYRLEQNQIGLLGMQNSNCYFYEVFVFNTRPESEKLDIIKAGQYQKYPGRKYLSCITVDLSSKLTEKHFKFPLSSDGLGKTIKSVLADDRENYDESLDFREVMQKKEKEYSVNFASKKAYLTFGLIAINIAVMIAIYLNVAKNNTDFNELLSRFGNKDNFKILSGEYWRFVTPIFLHGDEIHLLFNCISIFVAGTMVEKLFGNKKFAFIYFAAGIIGNIASFTFSIHPAVGASGAIFGLFGAILYYGIESPAQFKRYFGYNIIIVIAISLFNGFTKSGIDNFAHMGGLVGGFLAAGVVRAKKPSPKFLNRYIFIILIILLSSGGLYYGFNNDQNQALRKVTSLESLVKDNRWVDAEKLGEEILELKFKNQYIKTETLYYIISAENSLKKYEEGIEHAKTMLKYDSPTGHYLLGLLYYNTGKYPLAKEELLKAKDEKADYSNIDEILTEIDRINAK